MLGRLVDSLGLVVVGLTAGDGRSGLSGRWRQKSAERLGRQRPLFITNKVLTQRIKGYLHSRVGNLTPTTPVNYSVLCNLGLAAHHPGGPFRAIRGWAGNCQWR